MTKASRFAMLVAALAGCSRAPGASTMAAATGSLDPSVERRSGSTCPVPPRGSDAELAAPQAEKNVVGGDLTICSEHPLTGYYRDGRCASGPGDNGAHVVCAQVTDAFLDYTRKRGNDLTTPAPGFPGLRTGDHWCLCAARWSEALEAGVAPPVVLQATGAHAATLTAKAELVSHAL